MTYRERRERRAKRLRTWADNRRVKAAATLASHEPFRHDIAFNTQPGHIPFRARIIAAEDRAFASLDKAASMTSRADEINRQTDHAIYSDDHDAIDRLRERIAGLEVERARIKAVNTAVRKHGLARLCEPDPPFALVADEVRELMTIARLCPYHHCETRGFPPYALQNLGGNITRQRQRLTQLEQRARVADAINAERATEQEP